MGVFFHLSYCRKLCQCSGGAPAFSAVFPAVIQSPFSADMDLVRLVSSQLRLPVMQKWAGEELRAFFFFFCHDEKEKKVQYFNPASLSHVQASICMSRSHVIIPLCSGCCHAVVPLLLASVLFQLHNLHRTGLHGSHLTSVIWRHNRLFIS